VATNQEYDTQQGYHSELKEREFPRQTKVKGVHHHKTGLTRNVKRTSLSKKEKAVNRSEKIMKE